MVVTKYKGRWRAKVKAGRVNVASRTFDTKKQATDWEAAQKAALTGGFDPRVGRRMTVKVAADAWLESRLGSVASSTLATDRRVVKALPKAILSRPIGSLTGGELFSYLSGLRVAAGTKNRVKISLSAFMGWAVDHKLREDNPVKGIRLKSGTSEAMSPMTWAQIEGIAQQVRDPMYRTLIRVAAYTGLRWGELRALRVRDVVRDGDGLVLSVTRSWSEGFEVKDVKQHAARHVPVADAVVDDLRNLLEGRRFNDLVFTSKVGGPIHKSNFRRDCWNEIRDGHSVHDLRHTAISEWVRVGIPLATVKVWAGHQSLATTNRYTHSTGRAHLEGVALLNGGGHRGGTL